MVRFDCIAAFRASEEGATLVEYGVALIIAVIVGGATLSSLGQSTDDSIGLACSNMQPTVTGVNWQNSNTANC